MKTSPAAAQIAQYGIEGVPLIAWLALGGDCRKKRSGTTNLRSFWVRLGGMILSSQGASTKPVARSPIATDSEGGGDG